MLWKCDFSTFSVPRRNYAALQLSNILHTKCMHSMTRRAIRWWLVPRMRLVNIPLVRTNIREKRCKLVWSSRSVRMILPIALFLLLSGSWLLQIRRLATIRLAISYQLIYHFFLLLFELLPPLLFSLPSDGLLKLIADTLSSALFRYRAILAMVNRVSFIVFSLSYQNVLSSITFFMLSIRIILADFSESLLVGV